MQDHVLIKRGGNLEKVEKHYIKAIEEHKINRTDVRLEVENHLHEPCLFEENLTLKDIFSLVANNRLILKQILPNYYIDEFLVEGARNTPMENDYRFDLILNISWLVIHHPEFDELEMGVDFSGLSTDELTASSLSFIPLNEIIHCPISMDRAIKIYKGQGYPLVEKISHNEKDKCVSTHLGNKSFTLLDVLRGIFEEISFYGNPNERDDISIEVKERLDSLNI